MNKAVLMSTQPKWCENICHKIGENADGTPIYEKGVEIRKTRPKLETPFKVYIYCTNGKPILGRCLNDNSLKETPETDFDNYNRDTLFRANGKVIGEFVCTEIECFTTDYRADFEQTKRISKQSCVSPFALEDYEQGSRCLYAWHISNLVIYEKPKELSEFRKPCNYDLGCKCCSMYFPGTMFAEPYCKNGNLEIKRPPQSWCYVERLN